jgi:hypothetical protein
LIQLAIPALAVVILNKYISEQTWWLQQVLHIDIFYVAEYVVTVAILEAALISAVVVVDVFLTCYVARLHDIGDVLRPLIPGHDLLSCANLSNFEGSISQKRQGIVSFWNWTDSSGTINLLGGVHTVYVRKNEKTILASTFNATERR